MKNNFPPLTLQYKPFQLILAAAAANFRQLPALPLSRAIMAVMRTRALLAVGLAICALAAFLPAQMAPLPPAHRLFTWAAYPTDEIGLADARAATEITPGGGLYTGWGELDFYTGNPMRRVRQPERWLTDGDLPIVHYRFHDGRVAYQVALFSWALDLHQPDRRAINYIQIEVRNTAPSPRTSYFTVGFRYSGGLAGPRQAGAHRFARPALPGPKSGPGAYVQPGVKFDPN